MLRRCSLVVAVHVEQWVQAQVRKLLHLRLGLPRMRLLLLLRLLLRLLLLLPLELHRLLQLQLQLRLRLHMLQGDQGACAWAHGHVSSGCVRSCYNDTSIGVGTCARALLGMCVLVHTHMCSGPALCAMLHEAATALRLRPT